ncbi:hypothetical protein NP233_g8523 [Leucocoprinus birnbaumii]|uniref:Uncharacterized protein n=1 Tax=Leucocoprinus birnbaumii TaxID=56174 RepID=A0AAD5VM68_9AGAR|nr:hypothetical protein NP233_g8523 [Leucocoprinus birnbaumii]
MQSHKSLLSVENMSSLQNTSGLENVSPACTRSPAHIRSPEGANSDPDQLSTPPNKQHKSPIRRYSSQDPFNWMLTQTTPPVESPNSTRTLPENTAKVVPSCGPVPLAALTPGYIITEQAWEGRVQYLVQTACYTPLRKKMDVFDAENMCGKAWIKTHKNSTNYHFALYWVSLNALEQLEWFQKVHPVSTNVDSNMSTAALAKNTSQAGSIFGIPVSLYLRLITLIITFTDLIITFTDSIALIVTFASSITLAVTFTNSITLMHHGLNRSCRHFTNHSHHFYGLNHSASLLHSQTHDFLAAALTSLAAQLTPILSLLHLGYICSHFLPLLDLSRFSIVVDYVRFAKLALLHFKQSTMEWEDLYFPKLPANCTKEMKAATLQLEESLTIALAAFNT